jgi:hypothetical protein
LPLQSDSDLKMGENTGEELEVMKISLVSEIMKEN